MAGLIISDINGGDFVVAMVDTRMWEQIERIPQRVEAWVDVHGSSYGEIFNRWVGWLVVNDIGEEEPCPQPEGCPDREGKLIDTWYCQSPVIETLDIQQADIKGIVFIQG